MRYITVLLLGVGFLMPQLSSAAFILPPNTVGISETTYVAINEAECTHDECDPIVSQFVGKIVMRTEHAGELYQADINGGQPVLQRYLPNGFYTTGKKVYWLTNGYKTELIKGEAFQRVVDSAQSGRANRVIPISATDYELMQYATPHGFSEEDLPKVEAGSALFHTLAGTIIMRVDQSGVLELIQTEQNEPSAVIDYTGSFKPLGKHVQINNEAGDLVKVSFFKFIKSIATSVDESTIHQVPSNTAL